jgi:hypothetical protein
MDSLPIDVLGLIFDSIDSTADGARASEVCTTWNRAAYECSNMKWIRDLDIRTPEKAEALLATLKKRRQISDAYSKEDVLHVILKHCGRRLESLAFESWDSTKTFSFQKRNNARLKSLRIHAEISTTTPATDFSGFSALTSLSLGKCKDHGRGLRSSHFPKSLRNLELIGWARAFTMDSALPHLESVTLVDIKWGFVIGGRVRRAGDPQTSSHLYVPVDEFRCPALKSLHVKNSLVSFYTTATTLSIPKGHVGCVIRADGIFPETTFERIPHASSTIHIDDADEYLLYTYDDEETSFCFENDDDREQRLIKIRPALRR